MLPPVRHPSPSLQPPEPVSRLPRALAAGAIVALVLVGAVGCGSSGDSAPGDGPAASAGGDEAAVRDLAGKVETYTREGDARGFCGLFEQERMKAWVGRKGCVRIFSSAFRQRPDVQRLGIREVEVDGDRATVTSDFGTINFERIDGEWYLETPEPAPAPEPQR